MPFRLDFSLPDCTICAGAKRIALISAMALLPLAASPAFAQTQDAPPPGVVAQKIESKPITDPAIFSGTVEAIDSVDIMARVQGFLQKTGFEAGQRVNSDDVLFEIESAPYDAVVSSAKARVAQAEAQYKNAMQEYERQRVLVERNATAQSRLDQVEAEAAVAKADVASAEAQLDSAKIDQAYTNVHAPFAGEISRALYSNGALVGPQSGPLARLVRLDPLRVVFSIPDSQLVDMRLKQQNGGGVDAADLDFNVRLPGGTEYAGKGRIEYIASETDSGTGTVPVRLIFENPDKILIPGQFVDVMIAETDPQVLPVVPQTAILQDKQGRYVFVVGEDSTVSQRRITVGPKVDGGRAVTDGLQEGESVVTQGVQKIVDGARVQVADPSGGDGAAQSSDQN
ncbi:efflux RND transporter periplasmic adaptor subunit [Roseovarius sp. Pro17]|uniref:efflux RND transporter periplasmic adaptor subunit n=1 Tax=Roseovarius sp. Pro17 TaxID=3108175 RepID=UPI002D769358|nr:efflux RND transporter periplasmic adaptor subunit [Roseovarius sp. Pro17]